MFWVFSVTTHATYLSYAHGAPMPLQRIANIRSRTLMARAERVVRLMDRGMLDPILGVLLPGLGDVAGIVIGLYLVYVARATGASSALQARMLLNLALDGLLGAVPIFGDLFDFVFKANTRNLALLKRRQEFTGKGADVLVLTGAFALLLVALAIPVITFVAFLRWAF